jgi:hypothetical protein
MFEHPQLAPGVEKLGDGLAGSGRDPVVKTVELDDAARTNSVGAGAKLDRDGSKLDSGDGAKLDF